MHGSQPPKSFSQSALQAWQALCLKAHKHIVTFSFPLLLSHPHRSPLDTHRTPPLCPPLISLTLGTPCCPCPSTLLPLPTFLNTEPPRSMDLPWISPGSPLQPTDTHLRVFSCFPSFASLISPSTPHPLLPYHFAFPYLASIFDPLYYH